tara:strand:- start:572 stop:1657 length:1086 start_codon:yes stop_codon:yes gene_type:complete
MEVDLMLLEPFRPRLYTIIRRDDPFVDSNGKKFWRTGMTRALLQTMIRSLTIGVLTIGKGVAVAEALSMLDYENITIGHRLKPPPPGVAFPKRLEPAQQMLANTCEQVASCIAMWPRLETCLDSSLHGAVCINSVTATRAWIRFCKKPTTRGGSGAISDSAFYAAMARKAPRWFWSTLSAIGVVHSQLVRDGVLDSKARDREAYAALESAVEANGLGPFFSGSYDICQSSTVANVIANAPIRKEVHRGDKFAADMRNVINEGSMHKDKAALSFASAVFCLCEMIVNMSPSVATLFNGSCADDSGRTHERGLLQKALKQRGINIIKWADDEKGPSKPLAFPPGWFQEGSSSGPAVLLEFPTR